MHWHVSLTCVLHALPTSRFLYLTTVIIQNFAFGDDPSQMLKVNRCIHRSDRHSSCHITTSSPSKDLKMDTVCFSETLISTSKFQRRYSPHDNVDIFRALRTSDLTRDLLTCVKTSTDLINPDTFLRSV
jgi:hypothetical protein